ncbi:MAG TPA: MBL fold metallo-hydrolase, partial [Chitinophagales bacterium]|nr:MBL fold metallo-hydrolase [Chitinophagales bacterium]
MTVEQLYTNCLSEAAYIIESNGEAAVVDPLRDYQTYIDLAAKKGVTIKYIFETHFHADFVSGHIDLAKKTGAPIIYGPETVTSYPVTVATNKQRFKVGNVEIEVIHTPGHTPESTCYLLRTDSGAPYCIFTGDTLFVGDVGRPDLFGATITKEEMASRMYDSLNEIKMLP